MNGKLKASTIAVMAVGVTGLALINNKVRRFDTITRNSSKVIQNQESQIILQKEI